MMFKLVTILHKGPDFTLGTCCGLTLVIYFGTPEDSIYLHKLHTRVHLKKFLFYWKGLAMSLHFRLEHMAEDIRGVS